MYSSCYSNTIWFWQGSSYAGKGPQFHKVDPVLGAPHDHATDYRSIWVFHILTHGVGQVHGIRWNSGFGPILA